MVVATLVLLIVCSSLFTAAEMSLVSSRRSRLESARERGAAGARAALGLLDTPTRLFSTVQIGNTLITVLIGALGESAAAGTITPLIAAQGVPETTARHASLGVTVVAVTFFTIIFGELVPKRVAQSAPERVASILSPPMTLVATVAAPAVWLLSHLTDLVLAALRVRPRAEHEGAEDEVRSLMRAGARGGLFHESERQIVERVFALSDRTVKSIMVPRTDIDWLPADASVHRVRVEVATTSHSHFPVCRTGLDDLIGVVHVKDLVKSGLISDDVKLTELARKPVFVPESLPALKLLDLFRQRNERVAFVLDEYGVLEGLVTLNDVVEAIVGDTAAAGDAEPEPMVVRREDGSMLLDGMLPVGELRRLMFGEHSSAALPKEDEAAFETLGGFVLAYLGRIPATGDTFAFDRFRFEVVDMDRHRIDKVLLTVREAAPAEEPPRPGGLGADAAK